jgi:hypothetical protein
MLSEHDFPVRKVMLSEHDFHNDCRQFYRSDIGTKQATFGSAPKATSCAARATRHLAAQPRSVLPARPRYRAFATAWQRRYATST